MFVQAGFMPQDELDAEQFTVFIKAYPELARPILQEMRYEMWSEQYHYQSESTDDGTPPDKKSTAEGSHFSKASLFDLSHFAPEEKKEISNENLQSKIVNEGKSLHIIREPESGPIEFFTSKRIPQKKGILMKSRGE